LFSKHVPGVAVVPPEAPGFSTEISAQSYGFQFISIVPMYSFMEFLQSGNILSCSCYWGGVCDSPFCQVVQMSVKIPLLVGSFSLNGIKVYRYLIGNLTVDTCYDLSRKTIFKEVFERIRVHSYARFRSILYEYYPECHGHASLFFSKLHYKHFGNYDPEVHTSLFMKRFFVGYSIDQLDGLLFDKSVVTLYLTAFILKCMLMTFDSLKKQSIQSYQVLIEFISTVPILEARGSFKVIIPGSHLDIDEHFRNSDGSFKIDLYSHTLAHWRKAKIKTGPRGLRLEQDDEEFPFDTGNIPTIPQVW